MSGQKPVPRASKAQQILEWDFQRDHGRTKFEYFLPDPYPPCTTLVSDLTPITMSDLQPESHHRGRVLIVKAIETAIRDAAIWQLVMDEAGVVDRLALYNVDPEVRVDDVLPEETVFAIKEPFYTEAAGRFHIRVDHHSDISELLPRDPSIPKALQSEEDMSKSAADWKNVGNAEYKAARYRSALRFYSNGVDACGKDDMALKQDILRNRSIVNTYLKHFEDAVADAKASVISDSSEQSKKLNAKAYHRAGRAYYELRNMEESRRLFHKIQELTPSDTDAAKELSRIEDRVKEQTTGEYDLDKMSRSTSETHNRLDHADFTSNTVVKAIAGRGNGLVATKPLRPGEICLVEKAFEVSFANESRGYESIALDPKTKRRSTPTQTTLAFKLIDKVLHSEEAASQLFDLYAGGYNSSDSSTPHPKRVGGVVPIDSFFVQAVVSLNAIGCPLVRSSSKTARKQLQSSGFSSTGLWKHASYINHACDGNVMRSFIGDMMIVRATKDIAEGDEICMPYRLPHANNSVTQKELEEVWGFQCDCSLCQNEAATPTREKKEREQLADKVVEFLAQHKTSSQPGKKAVSETEKLYSKLESTYNKDQYENRPRLGLVGLGHFLCQAYNSQTPKAYPKLFETSLVGLLRNTGIILKLPPPNDFAKQGMAVERTYCQVEPRAVEAAMYATHAMLNKGQASAAVFAKFCKQLAEELWLIMYGEMRGFEDAFKEMGA